MDLKRYYQFYIKTFDLWEDYFFKISYLNDELKKELETNNSDSEYVNYIKDLQEYVAWQFYVLTRIIARQPHIHEDIENAFENFRDSLTEAEFSIHADIGSSHQKPSKIAEENCISKRTVDSHLINIANKIKDNDVLYKIFLSDKNNDKGLSYHLSPLKTIQKVFRIDDAEGIIMLFEEFKDKYFDK